MAVSLGRFIDKEKYSYLSKMTKTKYFYAAILFVRFSTSLDDKPNAVDHPNTEHVRFSSPDCTYRDEWGVGDNKFVPKFGRLAI